MNEAVTPAEAWEDFIRNVLPEIRKQSGARRPRTPDDIRKAVESKEGRHDRPPLGNKRIRHLLEKYAPGRYEFLERVEVLIHVSMPIPPADESSLAQDFGQQ